MEILFMLLLWEAFRSIADPAVRRAALWIGAWAFMPDLAPEMNPGWIKWDVVVRGRSGSARKNAADHRRQS